MATTHSAAHSPAPRADELARARAELAKATTVAKLATAKRARLAAVVRALEAEAEMEAMRLQARADRERAAAEARAQAAEDALECERAAHLAEEREAAAAELDRIKHPAHKRANGRGKTGANGYTATAEPSPDRPAALTIMPSLEAPG